MLKRLAHIAYFFNLATQIEGMLKKLFFLIFVALFSLQTKAGVYYWVGGTGNWSQFNTHWATTSGGAVFHIQTPTFADTVIFDANSFTTTGDTVFVDSTFISCKNMIWTNVTNGPVFTNASFASNGLLKMYGSLTLSYNMSWDFSGQIDMMANIGNQTITSAGQNLGYLWLVGSSQFSLTDSLNATYFTIAASSGPFYSNNQLIRTNIFYASNPVYLGTSSVYCGTWIGGAAPSDVDSSIIYLDSSPNFSGGANVYNKLIFTDLGIHYLTNSISTGNASFKYIYSYGGLNINASNCTIDSLICLGNFGFENMSNNNTLHFSQFNGDASIFGNHTFDTVHFNNSGFAITLENGSTQIINKLFINSTGGFPVTLQSNQPGTQATISKAIDTVCVNYIFMQDINATGGAQFYAGQYSSNISNNTGWNWMDCQQAISNVWPGDANYDLITDNLDIIYLGLAFNETGFTRSGASNTYVAQPAMDWNRVYTNMVNIKHADCDGNGVINPNDTMAVSLNYGLTNTGRLGATKNHTSSTGADIYFTPTQSSYLPGSWVSIPINLGTSGTPATNIYGLAYTITYDANMIQPGTVSVTYTSSWLVSTGNIVHLEKDFYSSGKIDVGMSRGNHANASGNGIIAYLNFQVSPTAPIGPINLGFTNITVMSFNENIVLVNPLPNTVTVGIENTSVASNINMYPNPFSNETFLNYSLAFGSDVNIKIYSVEGVLVSEINKPTQSAGNHTLSIDTKNIPSGVYFCKVKFSKGEKIFKLIKAE